jgi:hypothetical protein
MGRLVRIGGNEQPTIVRNEYFGFFREKARNARAVLAVEVVNAVPRVNGNGD